MLESDEPEFLTFLQQFFATLESPSVEETQAWYGAASEAFTDWQERSRHSSPAGHPPVQELPAELSVAVAAHFTGSLRDGVNVVFLLSTLLRAATVEPKLLYFPEEILPCIRRNWHPKDTLELLAAQESILEKPQPVRAASRPGRNDPCPCQSGKKFKRCCGE